MLGQDKTDLPAAGAVQRADTVHRYLAKFVDFLLVLALVTFLPAVLGMLSGLTYLCIADGFRGQSPGKRLIGLKVMELGSQGRKECSFRASLVRNSPLALAFFLTSIPLLNVALIPAVLLIVGAEAYFVWTDERGARIGDILAATRVENKTDAAQ